MISQSTSRDGEEADLPYAQSNPAQQLRSHRGATVGLALNSQPTWYVERQPSTDGATSATQIASAYIESSMQQMLSGSDGRRVRRKHEEAWSASPSQNSSPVVAQVPSDDDEDVLLKTSQAGPSRATLPIAFSQEHDYTTLSDVSAASTVHPDSDVNLLGAEGSDADVAFWHAFFSSSGLSKTEGLDHSTSLNGTLPEFYALAGNATDGSLGEGKFNFYPGVDSGATIAPSVLSPRGETYSTFELPEYGSSSGSNRSSFAHTATPSDTGMLSSPSMASTSSTFAAQQPYVPNILFPDLVQSSKQPSSVPSPSTASPQRGLRPSALVFPPLHSRASEPLDLRLPNILNPMPPPPIPVSSKGTSNFPAPTGLVASASKNKSKEGKRATLACLFCRARKLKCDQLQPCLHCSRRQRKCEYEATLSQAMRGVSSAPNGGVAEQPTDAQGRTESSSFKRSAAEDKAAKSRQHGSPSKASSGKRRAPDSDDLEGHSLSAASSASGALQQSSEGVVWVTCGPSALVEAMAKVRMRDESDAESDAGTTDAESDSTIGRGPGAQGIMDGWWNELLLELGPIKIMAVRRLRGLLLSFVSRHTISCQVLHPPTLLEPTFSSERRASVHPALYFAIAACSVVDHELDRPEPQTGVRDEASPHTKALSYRLAQRALTFLQTDAISSASPGMTIQTAQAAHVLSLMEHGEMRLSLLNLITRIVQSMGLMKLVSAPSMEALKPVKPHQPSYYALPQPPPPGTTVQAEIRRELIVRLCWARPILESRRITAFPDYIPPLYKFDEPVISPGHWSTPDFLQQHKLNSSLELFFVSKHLYAVAAWGFHIGSRAVALPRPTITSPFQAVGIYRAALEIIAAVEEMEGHVPFFRPKNNADLYTTVLGRHALGVCSLMVKLRLGIFQRGKIWRGRINDVTASITAPSGLPWSCEVYRVNMENQIKRITDDIKHHRTNGSFRTLEYEVASWQRHLAFAVDLYRASACVLWLNPISRLLAAINYHCTARSPMRASEAYVSIDWRAVKARIEALLTKAGQPLAPPP